MFALLMKHEIRQSYRFIITLFGAAVLLAVTGALILSLDGPILTAVGAVVGALGLLLLPFGLLGYFWWRYYQTMYGPQGYLSMTLPVKGRLLFWSKALWAFIVITVGYGLVLFGWAILVGIASGDGMLSFFELAFRSHQPLMVWGVVAFIPLGIAVTVVTGAFAITVGSEARFWRLGLGGPVLITFATYLVYQLVVIASMLFIPVSLVIPNVGVNYLTYESMLPSLLESIGAATPQPESLIGLGFIPAIAILGALASWWSVRSIERRTSLR